MASSCNSGVDGPGAGVRLPPVCGGGAGCGGARCGRTKSLAPAMPSPVHSRDAVDQRRKQDASLVEIELEQVALGERAHRR
jgi:hypothetical protein